MKFLYVDFQPLGTGSCMVVNYMDGIEEAYGDPQYCAEFAPDVHFEPEQDLRNPTELEHLY